MPRLPTKITKSLSIRSDLREGRENGFPLCCRLRFALTEALRPGSEQAGARGVSRTETGIEYVPCGVRHKATVRSVVVDEDGEPVLYIEP
jgi:hypothetical protein